LIPVAEAEALIRRWVPDPAETWMELPELAGRVLARELRADRGGPPASLVAFRRFVLPALLRFEGRNLGPLALSEGFVEVRPGWDGSAPLPYFPWGRGVQVASGKGYQSPSSFHQAPPTPTQMTMLMTLTSSPMRHQAPIST
jgi:hypothetical protein